MTMERYKELLRAAPPMTKADFSRLHFWRPKRTAMWLAMRGAFG
jgi:hypothetical protein